MAGYNKFQTNNAKYTQKSARVNRNDPDFTPAIDVNGENKMGMIARNIQQWCDLVAYYRAYPDLWYDLITPETGALIKLDLDQRVELRCLARFKSTYNVKPRGSGKTLGAMLIAIHSCCFYPRVKIALSAQTRESSAKLIKEKWDELSKAFPMLMNEVYKASFSKDVAEIEFHNGSRIINIANNQSSKGAHVQRGIMDEDNLTDEDTYLDVLEPIFTTVKRKTIGKECVVDPMENNGSINQMTSAGYRGSPAFYRCLNHYHNMVDLKGEICLGASWELPCFYGRGSTKEEILNKKRKNSAISFAMNYEAAWTGCSDGALVSISKLIACRNLQDCELKGNAADEYVLAIDIARSDNDGNNQTVISVLKPIRYPNGRVKEVCTVNIHSIKGTLDFIAQVIQIKRYRKLYNNAFVVFDSNGLGKAIGDEIVKNQTDPITGEFLPALRIINSDVIPELPDAEPCVFAYFAQKYDNSSIANFIDYVETGKLRLLVKKEQIEFEENDMPYLQTDFFIEEVSNLQLKHLSNGGLSIDRVVKKMDKDRFSSIQYGLWYIKEFMDYSVQEENDNISELMELAKWY